MENSYIFQEEENDIEEIPIQHESNAHKQGEIP